MQKVSAEEAVVASQASPQMGTLTMLSVPVSVICTFSPSFETKVSTVVAGSPERPTW